MGNQQSSLQEYDSLQTLNLDAVKLHFQSNPPASAQPQQVAWLQRSYDPILGRLIS